MFEINRHKYFLVRILKDVYSDVELSSLLGLKGGTALMLFYNLPRFSVDIDFNLLSPEKTDVAYNKLRQILLNYGIIKDEAHKHYGIIFLLSYGKDERNLKIEISTRQFPDSYEIKDFLGIPVKVMVKQDMFSNKLCALSDRKAIAARDIFDIYHFLTQATAVNTSIISVRTGMSIENYLDNCISVIEKINSKKLIYGLGELLSEEMKSFVKNKLKDETIRLLKLFKAFPLIIS